MLHNLSREAVAVRVGYLKWSPGNHDQNVSFSAGIIPAQTPVTVPTGPYITNQAPLAYSGNLCCRSACPQHCRHIETPRLAPMGGEGSSDYQVTQAWSGGRPDTYWASLRGQLSLHVGLCNECMLDSW